MGTDTITVGVFSPEISINRDTAICIGNTAHLYSAGGLSYAWSPAQYLNNPQVSNPIAFPGAKTTFYLTITDYNNCIEKDSVTVNIKPKPVFQGPHNETVCQGTSVLLGGNNSPNYIYAWSPASFLDDPNAPAPRATPSSSTTYAVLISDSICNLYDTTFDVLVTVWPSPSLHIQKSNDINCADHTARLFAIGADSYAWSPNSGLDDPFSPAPVVRIDTTTTYIVKGTNQQGCFSMDTVMVQVTSSGPNTFVVPSAFTPNGDGHNDYFGISKWGDVTISQFAIFNRWGNCVFSTQNPSELWDGNFNGQPQPTGTYIYIIKAASFCGMITKKGTLMLIR